MPILEKPETATEEHTYLGKPRKLLEGLGKVSGRARYAGDVTVPGMLHLRPVLSTEAHAKIVAVDKSEAEKVKGVVAVLTAADLVTSERTITSRSNAVLAKERVLFVGQPVVAVVAETEAAAEDGAARVKVAYESLPVVSSLGEAAAPDAPVIWPEGLPEGEAAGVTHAAVEEQESAARGQPSNIYKTSTYERGDVDAALKEADAVVEHSFQLASAYQGYLEPHSVLVDPDRVGGSLTVYTSTQGQFGVRNSVAAILGLKRGNVRVVPMTVGGGFGSKYGTIEPLAAAVAYTLNKPVRLVLGRSEDMQTTTPAPASQITVKLGAKKDGTLTALKAATVLDAGAFAFDFGGLWPLLLGSNYKVANLRIDSTEVITNKTEMGAYRAPGAPHTTFAMESCIDELARALELDPLEFRLKNVSEGGDPMTNGNPWPSLGLKECLEHLQEHPAWTERNPAENEGVGIAVSSWPCAMSPAASLCRIDSDGTVRIQVGSVDISGVNSSLVLVAAETLGVSPDEVELVQGDTDMGPFAPGSGGSQVTYSVAGAVAEAAKDVRTKVLELAAEHLEARLEDLELRESSVRVKGVPTSAVALAKLATVAERKAGGPGPLVGEGRAAVQENAPGTVAHLVKVAVDRETGAVTLKQYVAVQDVGFALNPMMVEGQIHGGVVQGVGMGLFEALTYADNGQPLTSSFSEYALPKAADVPSIETVLVQNKSPHGPFGARGVGEPPVTAGAAALANAIRDAVGVRVTEIPITPQKLWRALNEAG